MKINELQQALKKLPRNIRKKELMIHYEGQNLFLDLNELSITGFDTEELFVCIEAKREQNFSAKKRVETSENQF